MKWQRFFRYHPGKQLAALLGLARGAVWRLRGRSAGWPIVHPRVRCQCRGGRIELGHFTKLSRNVYIEAVRLGEGDIVPLVIGDHTRVWDDTRIMANKGITIGKDCAISWNCTILDCDKHRMSFDGAAFEPNSAPVVIEDHVWIGCNVTILKGVTIGTGAVIAAGSVVVHDIPAHMLAAGVPAKPIKPVARWD